MAKSRGDRELNVDVKRNGRAWNDVSSTSFSFFLYIATGKEGCELLIRLNLWSSKDANVPMEGQEKKKPCLHARVSYGAERRETHSGDVAG